MRQKCSRKRFILTISLLFSVSYSVTKIKKQRRQVTSKGRGVDKDWQHCQYPRSCVYVYEVAQVAEIFIGFSNTRASPFDLLRGIFLISIDGKYVFFCSHTSWHCNLSFKNTSGAGETGEAG